MMGLSTEQIELADSKTTTMRKLQLYVTRLTRFIVTVALEMLIIALFFVLILILSIAI